MNEISKANQEKRSIRQILDLQLAGEMQAAHDAYVEFFQENDPDYNALNLFGLCCVSLGKFEKAERIFEHITYQSPQISEVHINLAKCRFNQGKMELALEALQNFQEIEPNSVEAQIICARACLELGRAQQASDALMFALTFDSVEPDEFTEIASVLASMGASDEASVAYKKALFADQKNYGALTGQAEIFQQRNDWYASLLNTGLVLEQFPNDLRAGLLHAKALEKTEQFEEMLDLVKRISATAPFEVTILTLLCSAHYQMKDFLACIFVADKVLSLDENAKTCMELRASSYFHLGCYESALEKIDEVLDRYPENNKALQTKGVILERLCRLDEAVAIYDKILGQTPENQAIKFNKSICLLLKGDLSEGFRLYENRFNRETNLIQKYRGKEPLWNGQDLTEKHLLVHPEQGFGDTIMACRYIKFFDDNVKLTFAVPDALREVMETLDTSAKIIAVGEDLEKIDYHAPLMSIAHLSGAAFEAVNCEDPYLFVPVNAQEKWDRKFCEIERLRVGFVCSGNPFHGNDAARSINMSLFLNHLPDGPEYHLLQKDLRDTDVAAVSYREDIIKYNDEIETFSDTAAICSKMDLIVTVDTSIAHLAGALGLPTIVLLSAWPDWRWGLNRRQDIWYPQTTLLRQSELNDWRDPLEQLAALIIQKMAHKRLS